MRRPLIAGNWKMYKTIPEALDYVRALRPLVSTASFCDVVVAPPFTAISAVAARIEGTNIALAAQDIAAEPGPGAYTGEVSAAMLRDAGCGFAIIGHSERRQYYFESDDSVNRKLRSALDAGLAPVVCVGERLEDRDAGRAEAVVKEQVMRGMRNLTPTEASLMITAYEPVWAIGTGRTATPEIAQQMHSFIRAAIRGMYGSAANETRILYGGSVKPDNITALMREDDIDGALVGGASLDPESFAAIVNYR
jgi:triosephosphate isomerase